MPWGAVEKRDQAAARRYLRTASVRKTTMISEVLPLLHLHGLSSGDFVPALEQFLGSPAGNAVKKITDDVDELLAFYGFPAEHWIHLRTTNPSESTSATVRLRTKVTKGTGSAAAALRSRCVQSVTALRAVRPQTARRPRPVLEF